MQPHAPSRRAAWYPEELRAAMVRPLLARAGYLQEPTADSALQTATGQRWNEAGAAFARILAAKGRGCDQVVGQRGNSRTRTAPSAPGDSDPAPWPIPFG